MMRGGKRGRRGEGETGRRRLLAADGRPLHLPVSPSLCTLKGFTLLEIVLALGLTSLLLVAIYSALQMHWT